MFIPNTLVDIFSVLIFCFILWTSVFPLCFVDIVECCYNSSPTLLLTLFPKSLFLFSFLKSKTSVVPLCFVVKWITCEQLVLLTAPLLIFSPPIYSPTSFVPLSHWPLLVLLKFVSLFHIFRFLPNHMQRWHF